MAAPRSDGNNWDYKHRREAQSILPYLYLGPMFAAKDKEFLRKAGITMMLAIQPRTRFGSMLTQGALRVADEMGIAKEIIEVAHNQELISLFPTTIRVINGHLREMRNRALSNPEGGIRDGKVLIFCESGNEKSAGVAAAYLMENFDNANYIKACQICNQRRFCCSFDDGMKQLLRTYDDILKARRSVAIWDSSTQSHGDQTYPITNPFFGAPSVLSPQPQPPQTTFAPLLANSTRRTKRGRELDEEDMDTDEGEMDEDRFTGREMAPFH